jgi:hypothetical protein
LPLSGLGYLAAYGMQPAMRTIGLKEKHLLFGGDVLAGTQPFEENTCFVPVISGTASFTPPQQVEAGVGS